MTGEQASQVVAVLCAGFPNQALEEETLAFWISEIALLRDGGVALDAARKTAREQDRFPSLKDFRHTYRSIAEPERAQVRAIEEAQRPTRLVEWVYIYKWARAEGELRSLPQQMEWADPATMMSESDYQKLRERWLKAGAPRNVAFPTVRSM